MKIDENTLNDLNEKGYDLREPFRGLLKYYQGMEYSIKIQENILKEKTNYMIIGNEEKIFLLNVR